LLLMLMTAALIEIEIDRPKRPSWWSKEEEDMRKPMLSVA